MVSERKLGMNRHDCSKFPLHYLIHSSIDMTAIEKFLQREVHSSGLGNPFRLLSRFSDLIGKASEKMIQRLPLFQLSSAHDLGSRICSSTSTLFGAALAGLLWLHSLSLTRPASLRM